MWPLPYRLRGHISSGDHADEGRQAAFRSDRGRMRRVQSLCTGMPGGKLHFDSGAPARRDRQTDRQESGPQDHLARASEQSECQDRDRSGRVIRQPEILPARAMGEGGDGQVPSYCLANIGIARPPADRARSRSGGIGQNGYAFTRMIGAAPRRIASMVRGDDKKILGPEGRKERWQATVKSLQRMGVARGIAPMPVEGVEVDEIGNDQTAGAEVIGGKQRLFEQCVIPGCLDLGAGSAMSKNVTDLADG